MPPSQPDTQINSASYAPPTTLALLPFEAALFVVSNHLAEARLAWDSGETARAQTWFEAAEACALKSGYVELVQLVWADPDNTAPDKISANASLIRLPMQT